MSTPKDLDFVNMQLELTKQALRGSVDAAQSQAIKVAHPRPWVKAFPLSSVSLSFAVALLLGLRTNTSSIDGDAGGAQEGRQEPQGESYFRTLMSTLSTPLSIALLHAGREMISEIVRSESPRPRHQTPEPVSEPFLH